MSFFCPIIAANIEIQFYPEAKYQLYPTELPIQLAFPEMDDNCQFSIFSDFQTHPNVVPSEWISHAPRDLFKTMGAQKALLCTNTGGLFQPVTIPAKVDFTYQ
jgi:hypothetical protein